MRNRRRPNVLPALWLVVSAQALACTDTGLRPLWHSKRIGLEGHFCTEDPRQMVAPLKILFVIDVSGSMASSDANFARTDAVRAVLARYGADEPISGGLLRFASGAVAVREPQVCTYSQKPCTHETDSALSAFTTDAVILENAALATKHAAGDKPFLSTLDLVEQVLEGDIEQDPERAAQVRYAIVFLTDGAPCPAENQDEILRRVDQIREMGKRKTAKLALHTGLIQGAAAAACGNSFSAAQILGDMADRGGGEALAFADASKVDFQPVVQAGYQRVFELTQLTAENRNARLLSDSGRFLPAADSDGDGLADSVELQIGTSPTLADTDGDGCGDKLETERTGFEPLRSGDETEPRHCYCQDSERNGDTDGDDLTDCEEFFLGTDKFRLDSDGDNLPDGLEHRGGSDPAVSDRGIQDSDGDGVPNWDEVRVHTLPNLDESGTDPGILRGEFAYSYSVELDGPPVDGVSCYTFRVSNISVAATLAPEDEGGSQAGENEIEITFFQGATEDPESAPVIRSGRFSQFFSEPNQLVPDRKWIPVLPNDLQLRQ